ncbi:MAG TPA: hypothetical protein PLG17_12140 [Thermodesulfobacteriota bacterium]|nr:hypothetical protein [Thermodesulfobacteriota bacterium]
MQFPECDFVAVPTEKVAGRFKRQPAIRGMFLGKDDGLAGGIGSKTVLGYDKNFVTPEETADFRGGYGGYGGEFDEVGMRGKTGFLCGFALCGLQGSF